MLSIHEALESFKQVTEPLLEDLQCFLDPYTAVLPEARFVSSLRQFVPGMLAARSPQAAKAAAHAPDRPANPWSLTKQFYRLLHTPRFSHRDWLKCLYADARQVVQAATPERVLVALDPVNFEKAYAEKMEGISTVRKSTPPGTLPQRQARLTKGYPAILAQVVNLAQLAIPYARLFSYETVDFLSENRELMRAMRTIRTVLQGFTVCLVADAGLDDQKMFAYTDRHGLEFIFRAASDRWVDVHNPWGDRWERELLMDLVATVPGQLCFKTLFSHAGKSIVAQVTLDWFHIRLPEQAQDLWVIVAETHKMRPRQDETARWLEELPNPLVLITNRPVGNAQEAQQIYQDWRCRPTIDHFYRFIQEDGLDIEKIQVRLLERFRREFVLVLVAALFVLRLPDLWAPAVVRWLRQLGSGIAGTSMDRQGPYLLLVGLQRLMSALSVLTATAEFLSVPNARARPPTLLDQTTYG